MEENRISPVQRTYIKAMEVMRSRNRRYLETLREHSAAIRYKRLYRNTKERSSRASGSRCVLKGVSLDHLPIMYAAPVRGLACFICAEVPPSIKFVVCGHYVCKNCLDVAMRSSVLPDDDCAASCNACPKCRMHYAQNELKTMRTPSEFAQTMCVNSFNPKYGCSYQDRLENAQKRSELYGCFRAQNPARGSIPVVDNVTDRKFCHRDECSRECAYFSPYGKHGHGAGSPVCGVHQDASGRPAATAAVPGQISDSVEQLTRMLEALKPPTRRESKPISEQLEPHW